MEDINYFERIVSRPVRTTPPKSVRVKKAISNPIVIKREVLRRSLYKFIQEFWPEYSNDDFVGNWHIEILCKELENIAHKVANNQEWEYDLIANVPPGTSKTAVVSIFFPIWCWINWHWIKFITASYAETLALESADYSRDIMRSQRFKTLFPELEIRSDKDKKGNFKIVKTVYTQSGYQSVQQGGNRFSTSVGGTLTGFHGHILIVDDPLNPNQATSEAELRNANHWVSQTLSTRKANKRTATTIMIMQRLHQNDPSGYILNNKARTVKHLCLPGEIRDYRDCVVPKELVKYYKDDLLDPKRMPWSVIERLKADLGQYGYAGQIGQKPTPPGGGMFRIDNIPIVHTFDPTQVDGQMIRYWDKAGTQGGGAYTAGVKMARLKNGKYLILDVKRGQWSTDVRERIIKQTAQADGYETIIWIEQEPGSGGKDSAHATITNLAGFTIYKELPKGDKIYRADPFSVQVNEGNVMLLHGPWNEEYLQELEYFPFSTYKDQVDGSSGAFSKLARKKEVKVY